MVRLIPKQSAANNPTEPGNFRPIALTSCMGKVFTAILKDRWLHYMMANGYLDTNIQKAFIKNVPGCTEHYRKLLAAVTEAPTLPVSISLRGMEGWTYPTSLRSTGR